MVFLDPDNGLKVNSVGKKSARSVKYAFYEEVCGYIEQGQSVLIYNHRCRKPEKQYFSEICDKLYKETGIMTSEILKITFHKCSVRDYFAVPATSEHHKALRAAFLYMNHSAWGPGGKQVCRVSE